jgi:hypothetical protein
MDADWGDFVDALKKLHESMLPFAIEAAKDQCLRACK